GPFKSVDDFCRRLDMQTANKRVIESLIKAGALDCLELNRGALLNSLDRILAMAQVEQKLRNTGQATMFDLFGQSSSVPMPGLEINGEDVSAKEKLAWEKELMGIYLSEHPFARYAKLIDTSVTILPSQINAELDGQIITLVGMVDSVRELTTTKDHKPFCSAMITDDAAALEVMVWPRTYEDTRDLWKEGSFVLINGKVKVKEDRVQVTCDAAEIYSPENGTKPALIPPVSVPTPVKPNGIHKNGFANGVSGKNGNGKNGNGASNGTTSLNGKNGRATTSPPVIKRLTITIFETEDEDKDAAYFNSLIGILRDYPGQDEVYFRVDNADEIKTLKWPIYVDCTPDLQKRLEKLVRRENLKIE
ncbi:MAG TPA: OB-fold nucleic acid binding domain-containing protein, partial [Dehalococcoidales bacterium]